MENKANRFWLYLVGKEKKVFTKEEISESYAIFQHMWKDTKKDFQKVFDSLRKTRIKYMFHKKWYVLSVEDFEALKKNSLEEYELIFSFLEDQKIPFYIGLSSAHYLNRGSWQSMKLLFLVNTQLKGRRKIGSITIQFIKFPQDLMIRIALQKTNKVVPYSDKEKTLLDEVYYKNYQKGKDQIIDSDFENLNMEKIKAYLSFYRNYTRVKKELVSLLNKEQRELL